MKDTNDKREVTVRIKLPLETLVALEALSSNWGLKRSETIKRLLIELLSQPEND